MPLLRSSLSEQRSQASRNSIKKEMVRPQPTTTVTDEKTTTVRSSLFASLCLAFRTGDASKCVETCSNRKSMRGRSPARCLPCSFAVSTQRSQLHILEEKLSKRCLVVQAAPLWSRHLPWKTSFGSCQRLVFYRRNLSKRLHLLLSVISTELALSPLPTFQDFAFPNTPSPGKGEEQTTREMTQHQHTRARKTTTTDTHLVLDLNDGDTMNNTVHRPRISQPVFATTLSNKHMPMH